VVAKVHTDRVIVEVEVGLVRRLSRVIALAAFVLAWLAIALGILAIPAVPTIATILGLVPLLPAADQWQHLVEPGALIDERYCVERCSAAAAWAPCTRSRGLATDAASRSRCSRPPPTARARPASREAEIGASVRHPNVIAIHDVGVLASGAPFLAMDLIAGGSLEDARAARFGAPRWAIGLLADIAEGLETLHARGILHRDLKPANVLQPFAETIAAAAAPERDRRITSTGAILGTPMYMAPEAIDASAMDRAADVFAFGVVALELITGASPFPTPPLFAAIARAPPSLEGALSAGDPAARPTMAEVTKALRAAHAPNGDSAVLGMRPR
jgi:hypothetical protein